MDNRFGFIITRHVNSVKTNNYWNHCVKLIRTFYPLRKIIIIDDNLLSFQFVQFVFFGLLLSQTIEYLVPLNRKVKRIDSVEEVEVAH